MDAIRPYLDLWRLTPDGDFVVTASSFLLPVRRDNQPAFLKIAREREEQRAGQIMVWWQGQGSARVLEHDDTALLLERAIGRESLATWSRQDRDRDATQILCRTLRVLHTHRQDGIIHHAVDLKTWFADLVEAPLPQLPILTECASVARRLLADPRDEVILHGDLHHENVLHFGEKGWLAIDPKGLYGERTFDYANIFTNPDLSHPEPPVCVRPDRFQERLAIVTTMAGLDRRRLLEWILAWTGLSAIWYLSDQDPAKVDLQVAELARTELRRLR